MNTTTAVVVTVIILLVSTLMIGGWGQNNQYQFGNYNHDQQLHAVRGS